MNPSSIDTKQDLKCKGMRYEHKMIRVWPTQMGVTAGGQHRVASLKQRQHNSTWQH